MAQSPRKNSSLSRKKKNKNKNKNPFLLSPFVSYIIPSSVILLLLSLLQPGWFPLLFSNCLYKTVINDSPFPCRLPWIFLETGQCCPLSNVMASLPVSHTELVISLRTKVVMIVSFLFMYLWYHFMEPWVANNPFVFSLVTTTGSVRLPRWGFGKEPTCQFRRLKRHGFDPCVGKIPWRRAWQLNPAFLPGESHEQREPGRLQSIGFQRIRHDWSDLACMLDWLDN